MYKECINFESFTNDVAQFISLKDVILQRAWLSMMFWNGPQKKLGLQRRTHYLGMRIKLWQKQIEGLGWGFESAPNMVWCSIILLVSSRNKNHLFGVQHAGSITIICDPTSSAVWQGKSYVLTCLEHIKSSLNWYCLILGSQNSENIKEEQRIMEKWQEKSGSACAMRQDTTRYKSSCLRTHVLC